MKILTFNIVSCQHFNLLNTQRKREREQFISAQQSSLRLKQVLKVPARTCNKKQSSS